jgi:hypothetical protein
MRLDDGDTVTIKLGWDMIQSPWFDNEGMNDPVHPYVKAFVREYNGKMHKIDLPKAYRL